MIDPVITPTIASVVIQFVTSKPFQEFGLSMLKGVGLELGKSSAKSIINLFSPTNIPTNTGYKEVLEKYLAQDLQYREKALAAQEEFSKNLLNLLSNWQKQENENRFKEIQNEWDKDNWFSKLDRQETERILQQSNHRLLILASPPQISLDCPDSLRNNLAIDIRNKLKQFLSQHYSPTSTVNPVEFYGDYFKVPISDIDVRRLQSVLPNLPMVVLYTDITDYEVNFHLDCLGGEIHEYTFPAWNWEDCYYSLKKEGKNDRQALRQIRQTIVDVYTLLSAFISDWYYLQINPVYEPQFTEVITNLPENWIKPYAEPLQEIYTANQIKITYLKGLLLWEKGEYQEALGYFDEVLKVEPESAEVLFNIGKALKHLNNEEEAKQCFERALELQPDLTYDSVDGYTQILPNGVELEMVAIPAGKFMMGSNEYERQKPIHQVTLKEFYMGKYPITQAQYQAVMGNNPSKFSNAEKAPFSKGNWEDNPVECVSWNDAQEFCRKLSQITGKTYKLPSEAQWEYACRATPLSKGGYRGLSTKWCFGDDESQLKDYAWYRDNSNSQTHSVGQKKPNGWGLYDMHGNVWELCEDDWHANYNGAPDDGTAWIDKSSKYVVLRGGSWTFYPDDCRSASRILNYARDYFVIFGFRVVCVSGRSS